MIFTDLNKQFVFKQRQTGTVCLIHFLVFVLPAGPSHHCGDEMRFSPAAISTGGPLVWGWLARVNYSRERECVWKVSCYYQAPLVLSAHHWEKTSPLPLNYLLLLCPFPSSFPPLKAPHLPPHSGHSPENVRLLSASCLSLLLCHPLALCHSWLFDEALWIIHITPLCCVWSSRDSQTLLCTLSCEERPVVAAAQRSTHRSLQRFVPKSFCFFIVQIKTETKLLTPKSKLKF